MGDGLGRAHTMAIASVDDEGLKSWQTYDVGWDVLHDAPAGTGADQATATTNTSTDPAETGHSHDHAHSHSHAGHGAHHARIARFLKEHDVDAVVTGHAGPPMLKMLENMGIHVVMGASGDAKEMTIEAAQLIATEADSYEAEKDAILDDIDRVDLS